MKEYQGHLQAHGFHFAIVVSRFNEMITKNLLQGALDCLRRHGASEENITTCWVPGAFEIPLVAKQLAESKQFDAILCIGTLIKGATAHFEYVAAPVAAGIARITQDSGIPVIFSVLTTNTIEEAIERSGTKAGNKGFDYALSAIEMAHLMKQINDDFNTLDKDLKSYSAESKD